MCQAKPGPRCSRDTADEWKHLNGRLVTVKQELESAIDHENQALRYHLHYDTEDSRNLLQGWRQRVQDLETTHNRLVVRNREAELAFNASPQGIEKLRRRLESGNGRTKTFSTGFFKPDGDWAEVRYPEYLNTQTSYLLQQAEEHRKLQTIASATVNRTNKTEKYAAAHQLITRTTSEKKAVENSLQHFKDEEERLVIQCYETRNSTQHLTDLIAVKRSISLAEIKLTYLGLRINDLNQFLKLHALEATTINQK